MRRQEQRLQVWQPLGAQVLKDFAKLGHRLKEHIFTSAPWRRVSDQSCACHMHSLHQPKVRVVKVLGENGRYTVLFEDESYPQDDEFPFAFIPVRSHKLNIEF